MCVQLMWSSLFRSRRIYMHRLIISMLGVERRIFIYVMDGERVACWLQNVIMIVIADIPIRGCMRRSPLQLAAPFE